MTYIEIRTLHPKSYWKYYDAFNHITIDRTLCLELSSETLNYLEDRDFDKKIFIKAYCYEWNAVQRQYVKNDAKTRALINRKFIYID